ncbi:MAG: nodulation protein NfeD [Bryobacteraceae bacterium]|nr:nodulation protein NfeD [Bryobacteraceae bacterium]
MLPLWDNLIPKAEETLVQKLLTISAILIGIVAALPADAGMAAVSIDFSSVIHPVSVEILRHAIRQAKNEGAPFVLIRLNTPGGLLEATREIIEVISASPVPVVTFVTPSGGRAASAGFFILLSGDVAAMAAGTRTGAASPVTLGEPMDPVMRKKVESDAAAALRSLAGRHGRNWQAAEAAVLQAKSFTSEEALKEKLIDLVVRDEQELWAKLDGWQVKRPDGSVVTLKTAGVATKPYELTLRERVVQALADPNLAFLILVTGGLLLYWEFTQPGMILPGVSGAILLLLGLLALSVLPINFAAVGLLVLAVVLFVLEAKIVSHGILATGGVVAMVLGAVLLVEGPPELRIRWATALAVSIPFGIITVFLLSLVIRARLRPPATGMEAMAGETGVAQTALNPTGTVFVRGEYWTAEADEPVEAGARVRVIGIQGLRLKVKRAE